MIELLGRKRIHPGWVVPGGVTEPLDAVKRDEILALIPEAYANATMALAAYKQIAGRFQDEVESFANFPGLFHGHGRATEAGLEFTDAKLRMIDAEGLVLVDNLEAAQFDQYIGEAVEPYSYMKFPYLKSLGYPRGAYRVGPLARLNIASHTGTPLADAELNEFKKLAKGPVLGSFHYHHARLIEILHGIEVIEQLFSDTSILDKHVRATAGVNRQEGAGIAEAPRGTLMHHYKVDDKGLMTWANLVIATGQNNNAMNKGVLQTAQRFVKGDKLTDGMLNRVEAVIRTFDPCLSCSTHAFGQMPLVIELLAPDGSRLDEVQQTMMELQPHRIPRASPTRALLLACGNTFRGDDGVGWRIGCAVEQRSPRDDLTVVMTRQLLPEHAEAISAADVVVFVDCSAVTAAGTVSTIPIQPAESLPRILTHHLDPASLLRLAHDLYARTPARAVAITVGGESFEVTDR